MASRAVFNFHLFLEAKSDETGMKKILLALRLLAIVIVGWMVSEPMKPKPLAKVQVNLTHGTLTITNGNTTAWRNPKIILNDAFDGPIYQIQGFWPSGEGRVLDLRAFKGRLNQQPFDPEFEKLLQILVTVDGFRFQRGMYLALIEAPAISRAPYRPVIPPATPLPA
jgi:hypothetical protein